MAKKVKSTLYISEDKREMIRRSGLSIEAFCDKLFDMYYRFNIYKWKDGYFSIDYFRVCFLPAETLNLILDHFDKDGLYKTGLAAGKQLRSTMEKGFDLNIKLDDKSSKKILDDITKFSGWGCFTMKSDMIIITNPIFTKPHFIQGYLEGLMGVKLTLFEAYQDRVSFKINSNPN